jgi:hypothetical protein
MRTTINIDDDVMDLARNLADARRVSVGKALSELARQGARMKTPSRVRNGFHMFDVAESAPRFGLADLRRAQDADDQAYLNEVFKADR